FAYHLTPGGFIMESAAHALGCAVIPGGVGNTEQQVEAIAILKPSGYTATPHFLKVLLDTAQKLGKHVTSLRRGLVSRPPSRCSPASRHAGGPICASKAGWGAPTRPPRSRACSCIPGRWRRSPSGIPSSAGCGSR